MLIVINFQMVSRLRVLQNFTKMWLEILFVHSVVSVKRRNQDSLQSPWLFVSSGNAKRRGGMLNLRKYSRWISQFPVLQSLLYHFAFHSGRKKALALFVIGVKFIVIIFSPYSELTVSFHKIGSKSHVYCKYTVYFLRIGLSGKIYVWK